MRVSGCALRRAACPQMQRACSSLIYLVAQILPHGPGSDLRLLGKHGQHCGQPGIHELKMQYDILKLLQAFTCDVQGSPQVSPAADSPSPTCPPLLSPVLVVAIPQCRARGKRSSLPPCLAQLMAVDQRGITCPMPGHPRGWRGVHSCRHARAFRHL